MTKHLISLAIGVLFALTLMSPSCEDSGQITEAGVESTEYDLGEVSSVKPLTYSFENDYHELWEDVDSLENLGLYKSALDVVQVIFTEARKDENAPQVVKAVIHKMKYNAYLEDDDFVFAMNELSSLTSETTFPLKQIIHSVIAESYWGYYQANRWTFMNRTQTVDFENTDVRTWDLNKIVNHVNENYMLSLTSKDSLQHAKITDFSDILSGTVVHSKNQRPTLYDFLAYRALNYFESSEPSVTRPADKFTMTSRNYFGNSSEFLALPIQSADSLSNALHASKILQYLTIFHLKDKNPSALVDLELRRLDFARSQVVKDGKEDLYLKALENLAKLHSEHQASAEVSFKIATFYNQRGNSYTLKNQEAKWDKKKAMEICNGAIQKFPESLGARQCEALKVSIVQKNISFNNEVAYTPQSKDKMLIKYKNLDKLYFKMVKVDWDYFYEQDLSGEKLMEELLKKTVIHSWEKELTNPGDYQNHSTEILIPETEFGQYIVLASPSKEFKVKDNAIAYGSYWTTNLSYNFRTNANQTIDAYVTDRETG
ncbi:MAG: hypothetical protein ACI837_001444, partial [Crocinitomicaceae bacterium]